VTVETATTSGDAIGVDCPGSGRALGGGGSSSDANNQVELSAPLDGDGALVTDLAADGAVATGWFIRMDGTGGDQTVYAICAS
jgi:hypothetical protein